MKHFPSQYTNSANASTTSTESAFAFGFSATYLRVVNDKAARMYVDFSTGSASGRGSTNGVLTCASEVLEVRGQPVAGVAFASTTTTTGTLARVTALGS